MGISFFKSQSRVEPDKTSERPLPSTPLPDFSAFRGNNFEYKKALENRFGGDAKGMYQHVAGQETSAQKAILDGSDMMRTYLGIGDRRMSGPKSDTIHYTEAPTAWANAATLLDRDADKQRALDNLLGQHNSVRTRSETPQYKQTVEGACVHLLRNFNSLKNPVLEQKALNYINLSRNQLDGQAQTNIGEAAKKALDNSDTRYELRDSLTELTQPSSRSAPRRNSLQNGLSQQLNHTSQTSKTDKTLPSLPQTPSAPSSSSFMTDPRGYARNLQRTVSSGASGILSQMHDLGKDAYGAVLKHSGKMRDHLGISSRAEKHNKQADAIPNELAPAAFAYAAVTSNNERQIQRALDNMAYRLEKNPLGSDHDQQQDYRKSVENGFVTLLASFSSLKNDTLKQKAAVLINRNYSKMDSSGQSRIRQAAEVAIGDPATATALKHMLKPLTKAPQAPVAYSSGRAAFNAKMVVNRNAVPQINVQSPGMQPANYWQAPINRTPPPPQPNGANPYNPAPQPHQQQTNSAPLFQQPNWGPQTHQTSSAPVYSSFQQPQQTGQNPFIPLPSGFNQSAPVPPQNIVPPSISVPTATAASIATASQYSSLMVGQLRQKGLDETQLLELRNLLSATVSGINTNGDPGMVNFNIGLLNAKFSAFIGNVDTSSANAMDMLRYAIDVDLTGKGYR
jgi:hypothetical protein